MTSKIYASSVLRFLVSHGVGLNRAIIAQKTANAHGTVAVSVDGLITYEFAEDYGPESAGGYFVHVQNALV